MLQSLSICFCLCPSKSHEGFLTILFFISHTLDLQSLQKWALSRFIGPEITGLWW